MNQFVIDIALAILFSNIEFLSTAVNAFISEHYIFVATKQTSTLVWYIYCLIAIIVAELWNTLATPDIEL